VVPQSRKKSFLRSLFCGSVTIASRLCGLSTYRFTPRMAETLRLKNKQISFSVGSSALFFLLLFL
jgi:hypothetical protein